jgi:phosphatidylglycerophosphate synthase
MKQAPPYLKETDAWSTVLFADPIGILLAKLLSHTPIHPNVVTLVSMIPALACCYFFWRGDPLSFLWGALLFHLSWILDCTDGKLAKMTGKQTEFGRKLDPIIDLLRKLFSLAALAWGTWRALGLMWGILTGAGVIFHYGVHLIAHHTPPRIRQTQIPQIPPEKRLFRRVGQLYTAYDEQFFILFLGPAFAWLAPNLPTCVLWGASFLYAINILVIKIQLTRKGK